MISSYRLGDLVLLELTKEELIQILIDHPHSIGSEFIMKRQKTIDSITEIVLKRIQTTQLPKDIEESTVIHVRLGDVMAGNKDHEIEKRPYTIDYLKSLMPTTKKYVIGKCFFAAPSSTNYDECIRLSNEYLQNILCELNAEHFDSGDADIDLCCAVKAKVFVKGKGYYSRLIAEIRKKLHLETI